MNEDIFTDFHRLLHQFNQQAPTTKKSELDAQLKQLTELLILAEKILLYLAMHKERSDDLLTYLFEYKQLLRLEENIRKIRYNTPTRQVVIRTVTHEEKPWWKLW